MLQASSFTGLCWRSQKPIGGGAGISAEGGNIYCERCGFYDLKSGGDGGAVYSNGGSCEFVLCEFKVVECGSYGSGGGIYASNSKTVSLDSCIFERATSRSWAGAFYADGASLVVDVRNSQFVQCTGAEGAVCYCKTSTQNITFDNCTISDDQSVELKSGIYTDFTKSVSITIRDCVFNLAAAFSSSLFWLKSSGDVVFENNIFNRTNTTGGSPLIKNANSYYIWKSLQVLGCDFQSVTAPCDGPAIDTQDVVSAVIDNCSFEDCRSTASEEEETQGGVVVIGVATTQFTISTCRFIANSCPKGVHSLHILSSSAFNLTNCTFSGHVGSLPVLKAETPAASLLSSDEFALVDCVFEENALDGKTTGIVTFPQDKAVRLERCSFVDNKASVTQTQCTKIVYDSCFFNVSLDDSYCPPIGDYGTPAIEIISCGFAHYGATSDGQEPIYVEIKGEDCQVNVSDACFGSGETNAISGGNVTQSGSQFGADCQPPWAPPPEIESQETESQEIEDPDDFPLAAVVGGVVGAVVVIVIIVVVAVLLTRRKKVSSTSTTDHETVLTS